MALGDEGDFTLADRDLAKGHPRLQERVPALEEELERSHGWRIQRVEVYRTELRQQWLYGSGRTVGKLNELGISSRFARPSLKVVTNASSARLSAHGWTEKRDGLVVPAAAAIDCGPVGQDGKLWTADDPWDDFVRTLALIGPKFGLVHFHSPGKAVWDRPHLELLEWSNREHRVTNRKDPSD
jgi:hypothetical protein